MLEALADKRSPDWFPGETSLTIVEGAGPGEDIPGAETVSPPTIHHATSVWIDPEYVQLDESGASPSVVLYHELGHVYDRWNWSNDDREVSGGRDDGVRHNERRATGLPIDHDGPASTPDIIDPKHPFVYTENAMRKEMGLPPRDTYRKDGD